MSAIASVAPAISQIICSIPGADDDPDRARLAVCAFSPLPAAGSQPMRPSLVTIDGEFDRSTVSIAGPRCHTFIREATGDVIIDLSNVTVIDSAGVRLLEHLDDALDGDRMIHLGEPSAIVRRVFDVFGLPIASSTWP